jgi:hypothetical protein
VKRTPRHVTFHPEASHARALEDGIPIFVVSLPVRRSAIGQPLDACEGDRSFRKRLGGDGTPIGRSAPGGFQDWRFAATGHRGPDRGRARETITGARPRECIERPDCTTGRGTSSSGAASTRMGTHAVPGRRPQFSEPDSSRAGDDLAAGDGNKHLSELPVRTPLYRGARIPNALRRCGLGRPHRLPPRQS